MTLGHVYDLDLKKNELLIKETIVQAQGEVGYLNVTLILVVIDRLKDGIGRIHQTSKGNLDKLHVGFGELPK